MSGFMPGIHVFIPAERKDVDGWDKPGYDDEVGITPPCGWSKIRPCGRVL